MTGRLSSAEPNLQQLPRGSTIRKLFVAGADHVLIVADYDQIELRCLAYAAEEPAMIEIFRQGRDIHAEATAVAMQIALAQVTGDLRQVGKTLNFATGYGAGARAHRCRGRREQAAGPDSSWTATTKSSQPWNRGRQPAAARGPGTLRHDGPVAVPAVRGHPHLPLSSKDFLT